MRAYWQLALGILFVLVIVCLEAAVPAPMLFRPTARFIIMEKRQVVAAGRHQEIAASEIMQEHLAI